MPKNTIRIATRKSPLALWQAEFVGQTLLKIESQLNIEFIKIVTEADNFIDKPLHQIGGKGLFVKELELALLEGKADIAVHSMKDVPMELPKGLGIAAICERDDPRDAFVAEKYQHLDDCPKGAIIGTSSLRRQCQLRAHYPDLIIKDLRGNVGTRLEKLDRGEYDAIILACAGLKRLQLSERIRYELPIHLYYPAVGQGAIGIECRQSNTAIWQLIEKLNHPETQYCIKAERAMNLILNGGCQVPIGAWSSIENNQISLHGLVGSRDGKTIIRAQDTDNVENAELVGERVAKELLKQGAKTLLQSGT